MTWRAWSSDADGGVRTSILTAQTTPAPDLTRRVTPQNPRSQHYHHDFAEALTCHRRRELLVHAARIGATTPTPGPVGAKHRALARRIDRRIEDYLRFATDPRAPWDNNAAEREIRMAKLRQKISGGMRTLTGAQHFAALRSYLATTAKHGINGLDALTQLTTGNPWQPQMT